MKRRWIIWAIGLFLVGLLAAGTVLQRDYGYPWDEQSQIALAKANLAYLTHADPGLLTLYDRYYGPVVEIPLFWAVRNVPAPQATFTRHLLLFLFFVCGVGVFIGVSARLLHNRTWGLLAGLLLVFSPRIFADAFYNSKDIPFMVEYIFAAGGLLFWLDALDRSRGWGTLLAVAGLNGVISAAVIATRVPGVMLLPLTAGAVGLGGFSARGRWLKTLLPLGCYLLAAAGLTVLFWPVLWTNPIGQLAAAFKMMSRYPFPNPVLYLGKYYLPADLPWHYCLVWMAASTPLVVLAGFGVGAAGLLRRAWTGLRAGWGWLPRVETRARLWVAGWLLMPLAAVWLFKSALYDGWRQLFFIYPAALLVAVFGLKTSMEWASRCWPHSGWRAGLAGLVLVCGLAEPLGFMLQEHPHENIYFNPLAGDSRYLRQVFDLDYWGLSYKQGIDALLARDSSPHIKVSLSNVPGKYYIRDMLLPDQAARIELVAKPEEADYFIGDYRWHPPEYPYPRKVFSVDVGGESILGVFQINPQAQFGAGKAP